MASQVIATRLPPVPAATDAAAVDESALTDRSPAVQASEDAAPPWIDTAPVAVCVIVALAMEASALAVMSTSPAPAEMATPPDGASIVVSPVTSISMVWPPPVDVSVIVSVTSSVASVAPMVEEPMVACANADPPLPSRFT